MNYITNESNDHSSLWEKKQVSISYAEPSGVESLYF